MDNSHMEGDAVPQMSNPGAQTTTLSRQHEELLNNGRRPNDQQRSTPTAQRLDNQNEKMLGGIAFDHGKFPKIVAVHSIQHRTKIASPVNNASSVDGCFPHTRNPEQGFRSQVQPTAQHLTPQMHQDMQAIPPNAIQRMPQQFAYYNHLGYRPVISNNHPPHMSGFPQQPYMAPLQRQYSLDSNKKPQGLYSSSNVMHSQTPSHSPAARNATSSNEQAYTINHRSSSEPPTLLPIAANLRFSANPSVSAQPHFNNGNLGLIRQNHPHSNLRHPAAHNIPMFLERHPFHHSLHHNQTILHNSISAARFPYDRFPINTQTSQQHYMQLNSMPTFPDRTVYPNVDSSFQIINMPYANTSLVHRPPKSDIGKVHQGKPYSRPIQSGYAYSDLLKLENKCDLLHLLKLGADHSRLELYTTVVKLLEGNFLENSLCLLESIKSSDLTEKTKEKILSVVEELVWKTPPREDIWENRKCYSIDDNSHCADIEFEKQQEQYLEELMKAAMPQSDPDEADSEHDNGTQENGTISAHDPVFSSPESQYLLNDHCTTEENGTQGFSQRQDRLFERGLDTKDKGEPVDDVVKNIPNSKPDVWNENLVSPELISESQTKSPVTVKQEPLSDEVAEETLFHHDASFNGSLSLVKNEPTMKSSCLKEANINKEIKDRFQTNNHVVRNIFDLFT